MAAPTTNALQKHLDQVEYLRERIATNTINLSLEAFASEHDRLARLLDTDERELAHLVAHIERELADEPAPRAAVPPPTREAIARAERNIATYLDQPVITPEQRLLAQRIWAEKKETQSSPAPPTREEIDRAKLKRV